VTPLRNMAAVGVDQVAARLSTALCCRRADEGDTKLIKSGPNKRAAVVTSRTT